MIKPAMHAKFHHEMCIWPDGLAARAVMLIFTVIALETASGRDASPRIEGALRRTV